jgi:hypothetical protein
MAVVRSQARLYDLSVIEFVGRDLSWTVLRDIEKKLTHLFGPRWTEKGR